MVVAVVGLKATIPDHASLTYVPIHFDSFP